MSLTVRAAMGRSTQGHRTGAAGLRDINGIRTSVYDQDRILEGDKVVIGTGPGVAGHDRVAGSVERNVLADVKAAPVSVVEVRRHEGAVRVVGDRAHVII